MGVVARMHVSLLSGYWWGVAKAFLCDVCMLSAATVMFKSGAVGIAVVFGLGVEFRGA